ncbi:MAG: DUF4976 domain-containing protein, partial [Candidatus Omnitrophica bacterium]|nr:DUF4976 domain-containing protein [Candidatus Omnitrophota bacterium]
LRPILEDPSASVQKAALTQVSRRKGRGANADGFKGYSIRTDRYRYTEWDGGKEGVELYDHENDAMEFNNLAEKDEASETVKEMKSLLQESMKRAGSS